MSVVAANKQDQAPLRRHRHIGGGTCTPAFDFQHAFRAFSVSPPISSARNLRRWCRKIICSQVSDWEECRRSFPKPRRHYLPIMGRAPVKKRVPSSPWVRPSPPSECEWPFPKKIRSILMHGGGGGRGASRARPAGPSPHSAQAQRAGRRSRRRSCSRA